MKSHLKIIPLIIITFIISCSKTNNENITIIPKPEYIEYNSNNKTFTFNNSTTYFCEDSTWNSTADEFFTILDEASGIKIKRSSDSKKANISFNKNTRLKSEAYTISIMEHKIIIEAFDKKGIFYALQTIRQVLPPEIENNTGNNNINWTIPCLEIKDEPRFEYRGLMLDVSRFFIEKEEILKIIDAISALKINKLHLHLVDDQGWRLEIKKYPKLTEIGAWRVYREGPFSLKSNPTQPGEKTPVGGFYTQNDMKEIISYAAKHNIEVIPEIEMPAHTNSSLAAYPQYACPTVNHYTAVLPGMGGVDFNTEYCAGNEDTYLFLQNILDEVIDLFPSQYIHLGGDEANKIAWKTCPKCQALMKKENIDNVEDLQGYFMNRMTKYVQSKGKKVLGWDELTNSKVPDGVTIFGWRGYGEAGYKAGKEGHNFVMTPAKVLYFIRYQGPQWFEPRTYFGNITLKDVYDYEPIQPSWTKEVSERLIGLQASLWTEFIESDDEAEYMIFPRIAALSEIAWAQKGNKDWEYFIKGIDNLVARWNYMGINYAKSMFNIDHKAIPSDNGTIKLSLSNIRPDIDIRYTTDNSEPTENSNLYNDTIIIDKAVTVKAATFKNGVKKGQTLVLSFLWNKATAKEIINSDNKDVYCLTNGIKGSDKHSDFEWCGWYDKDTEFTLNLGKQTEINKVILGHVVNYGMGVHYPKSIKLSISNDNTNFRTIRELTFSEEKIYSYGIYTDKITFDNIAETGQYLKFEIESPGKAPDYHARKGQGVWLYFDEIEVY